MNKNKHTKTYNKWVEDGYKYFAEVGPTTFSIKELSEISELSRTSFNYYFDNKNLFFNILIEYHLKEIKEFGKLAVSNKTDVTSGIIKSMEKFHIGMKFHTQLFNNRKNTQFNNAYLEGHKIRYCNGILNWFIDYFKLNISKENGKKVFLLFVDVLNTRFNISYQHNNSISFSTIFLEVIADFKLLLKSKI